VGRERERGVEGGEKERGTRQRRPKHTPPCETSCSAAQPSLSLFYISLGCVWVFLRAHLLGGWRSALRPFRTCGVPSTCCAGGQPRRARVKCSD
jgi:hypothetical protein